MRPLLTRFWFEFEIDHAIDFSPGVGLGCGVTAFSDEDALALLDQKVFDLVKRPPFKKVIENIDIRKLDQGHVIPNMKPPVDRGIWFPLGYDQQAPAI